MNTQTPNDKIIRVGDGVNFWNSSRRYTWGLNGLHGTGLLPASKIERIKKGDRLWFVLGGERGQIVAVATFDSINLRGDDTPTDEELGWTGDRGWDYEIHYNNLYDVSRLNLLTYIGGQCRLREYNENCEVDLPHEYPLIVRYSSAVNHSGGGGVGWRVVM